jgi:hypothetical protein
MQRKDISKQSSFSNAPTDGRYSKTSKEFRLPKVQKKKEKLETEWQLETCDSREKQSCLH